MKILLSVVILLAAIVSTIMFVTHVTPLSWGAYQPVNTSNGLALEGYDPVSYLKDGSPIKGSADYKVTWQTAEWYFSTAENKTTFLKDPEKYAPQFGVNCAQAISDGFTASGDPTVWHIEDGKVYVFFMEKAKSKWLARLDQGVVALSHKNWDNR